MMPREMIRALVRGLDIQDRLSALLVSFIDDDADVTEVSLRMLNALVILCRSQSTPRRFRLANHLRDVADQLERPDVLRDVSVN